SSKGQLVLPAAYRRKMGLSAGSEIRIREDGERLILEPAQSKQARFVQQPGYKRPILSIGGGRKITNSDLIDPLEDDA
ncbi:MAG: AbrB/MazE/SpoVT family DNA-binding domain-containing protein, partial [Bdellovibrionales bacterium]